MTDEIAPGFTKISGKRNPPAEWGERLFVQLRNGMLPSEPWPVGKTQSGQTRWIWGEPDPFDIIAVRRA